MLDAAAALLAAGRWSAAYYLAGYAVECALKACVLGHLIRTDAVVIFRDRKYSENCWKHDFEKLIQAAGLKGAEEEISNEAVKAN